ncbi:MAG: mechanosensitive ion channel family protein [Clostridiales bacterium]|nr:mechanosensitive ion channel family protein [Clostridiales bacterium]
MLDQENITQIVQSISWQNLLIICVTAVAGFFLVRLLGKSITRVMNRTRLAKGVQNLICTVIKTILWALLIIAVISSIGVDMGGVIAILSVGLLAVSMAVQEVLSNVAGGVQVISNHPLASGDFVKVGEISGTVKEVELTYTLLETPDGQLVHIPNSITATREVTNYTALGHRRLDVVIGISYNCEPEKVKEVLLRLLRSAPELLEEPAEPCVLLSGYGDSAIEYTMRAWVRPEDYWPVKFRLQDQLYDELKNNGISIPYPQVDVHMIS